MQIPTATIDLDSAELHSSGDEKTKQSPQRSKPDTSKMTIKLDYIDMPPELVITSTQGNDLSVFERLYKSAQQSKVEVSKSPTRRDSCRRCSPGRYGKKGYSPNSSDAEGRSRYEATFPNRQQFWKVVSHGSLSYGGNNCDQEQLLKACSEKLTELKKKHKLKKLKYSENAVLSVPKLFFSSRRLKRKARSFNLGKSLSPKIEPRFNTNTEIEDTVKKKSQNKTKEVKHETTAKPRKFKKGGIVSLATVHKTNAKETNHNEEILENISGKKKKKIKKLSQLQRRVKNAVHTVTVVAKSSKKLERSMSSRKSSSAS